MKTLKQGSRGADVKLLQSKLGITADGIFGKQTKAAVIAYQESHLLIADGIVGVKTWAALTIGEIPQSPHFKLSEFKCHNGKPVPPEYYGNLRKLMSMLEEIRTACGDRPITIVSGYRTPDYNKKVGGASKSQHKYAAAADIKVAGLSPSEVYAKCNTIVGNRGGVGKYTTFTHIDVRGYRSRW